MTFTATGSWQGSSSTTLTVSNQAIGNLLIVEVINPQNKTVWCSSLSGGKATWVAAGVHALGSTNTGTAAVFFGTVTGTGAGTVTPSWSGTAPTAWNMAGHEFPSTAGWAFDKQGTLDSSGTASWPSLTAAGGAGELYFGLCLDVGVQAVAGSTTGYVYNANVDTQYNGAAFNVNCPATATHPVWGDSTEAFGIVILVAGHADVTVSPDTVTVTAGFPAPVVTGNCAIVAAATVTATATVLSPSVSPPQIFHVGDSALYTGTDISPVVAYNSGAGNTLVAVITAYTTGNYPAACNGVFDDTLNTWTITDGGGSYDASTGLYGFTTIATCVSALPITLITVYFNANNNYILYGAGASVQVSEFAGLPVGSTPQVIAAASPDAHTGAYTAPGVTVPDGAYLILSAVASRPRGRVCLPAPQSTARRDRGAPRPARGVTPPPTPAPPKPCTARSLSRSVPLPPPARPCSPRSEGGWAPPPAP